MRILPALFARVHRILDALPLFSHPFDLKGAPCPIQISAPFSTCDSVPVLFNCRRSHRLPQMSSKTPTASLFCSGRASQEQAGTLRTGRSNQHASFFAVKRSVLDQFEA